MPRCLHLATSARAPLLGHVELPAHPAHVERRAKLMGQPGEEAPFALAPDEPRAMHHKGAA